VEHEEQNSYFKVCQFNKDSFYSILTEHNFSLQEIEESRHIAYLFGYLTKLNTKCLIVEEKYTDIDYIDSFANYYSSCYVEYPRSCKRIHAFSIDSLTEDRFSEIVVSGNISQGKDLSSIQNSHSLINSYLGFIVILPFPGVVIGRTILATYKDDLSQGSSRNYSCTRDYSVNLFGINLIVEKSLAFQQQDRAIMACASVSIWCALHRASDLFDTALPRPSAITKAAVASYASSRGFPSKGLTLEQMCKAIVHFGLEPEVIRMPGKQDLPILSLIYGYLKMGIPIILGCDMASRSNRNDMPGKIHGGHAITLVGYGLSEQPKVSRERQLIVQNDRTKMISLKMSSLYAHDDQLGPFSKLDVQFIEEVFQLDDQGNLKCGYHPIVLESQYDVDGKDTITFYPTTLIIPTYHKIRVPFIDIYKYVNLMNDVFLMVLKQVEEKLPVKLDDLEWDVHLTTTNDLKDDVRNTTNQYVDNYIASEQDHSRYLREKLEYVMLDSHPRFVWRATLKGLTDSKEVIEIIDIFADATGVPNAFPMYDMIWYEPVMSGYLKEFFADTSEAFVNKRKRIKRSLVRFICENLGVANNEP
jgi:hypothetical protein